jgi:MerR HTH family regulatory protein
MESNELIPVHHFCVIHSVELSFIESLQQYGLVEITSIEEKRYLKESQLGELEKFVRLHYDLDINIEGIEAISHLLQQLQDIQARNMQLQNRLRLYETL